jgi:hypothetical protein
MEAFGPQGNALSIKAFHPAALQDAYGREARIEKRDDNDHPGSSDGGLEQRLPWLASSLSDREIVALVNISFARAEFNGWLPTHS